jgi:hypothetical protein
LADFVASECACGECFGHEQHCATCATANVGNLCALLEHVGDVVESGENCRDEVGICPRFETALDANCAFGAVAVVVVADTGAKTFGHALERLHCLRKPMKHAHAESGVIVGGKHHRLLR